MNETEKILIEMLCENTGKMLGDSGNAYGRQWERNRTNGVKTGEQVCDFWEYDEGIELIPIIPIYDIFRRNLEYDEDCKKIEEQIESIDDIEKLVEGNNDKFEDIEYWTGAEPYYTYGSDYNICSQDYIQALFTYEGEDYICISVHNGCDARWGFTNPHIFRLPDVDNFIVANERCFIYCGCDNNNYYYSYDEIYDYTTNTDLDEKELKERTYVDDDGNLRCKECGEIIKCLEIDL